MYKHTHTHTHTERLCRSRVPSSNKHSQALTVWGVSVGRVSAGLCASLYIEINLFARE